MSSPGQRPQEKEEGKRACREMPPVRLKLRDLPRLQDGPPGGDDNSNVNKHRRAAAAGEPQQSSAGVAVGAGIAARTTEQLADAWRVWPVMTISAVQAAVKGWFTRMDAALLGLPRGLGPAVSSLVRETLVVCYMRSFFTRKYSATLKRVCTLLYARGDNFADEALLYEQGVHLWVPCNLSIPRVFELVTSPLD